MTNEKYAEEERKRLLEVAGRNREILGDVVLPEASEIRKDTPLPKNLTSEQVVMLRENMEPTGFGRLGDRSLAEAGMVGAAVNIEGGRFPIKVRSELELALDGQQHGPIVFTGSPSRQLDDKEIEFLGGEGSEYDGSSLLMKQYEGFTELVEPQAVSFGYEVDIIKIEEDENGNPVPEYRIKILDDEEISPKDPHAEIFGEINNQPVARLKVDKGEYLFNGIKRYVQPNPGELAELTAQMLAVVGYEMNKVATVTGGLYAPSRSIDVIKQNKRLASVGNPLIVGIATYGRTRASGGKEPEDYQLISEVSRLEYLGQGSR